MWGPSSYFSSWPWPGRRLQATYLAAMGEFAPTSGKTKQFAIVSLTRGADVFARGNLWKGLFIGFTALRFFLFKSSCEIIIMHDCPCEVWSCGSSTTTSPTSPSPEPKSVNGYAIATPILAVALGLIVAIYIWHKYECRRGYNRFPTLARRANRQGDGSSDHSGINWNCQLGKRLRRWTFQGWGCPQSIAFLIQRRLILQMTRRTLWPRMPRRSMPRGEMKLRLGLFKL